MKQTLKIRAWDIINQNYIWNIEEIDTLSRWLKDKNMIVEVGLNLAGSIFVYQGDLVKITTIVYSSNEESEIDNVFSGEVVYNTESCRFEVKKYCGCSDDCHYCYDIGWAFNSQSSIIEVIGNRHQGVTHGQ